MSNKWILVLVVTVVFGGAGFWGGMKYSQNKSPASQFAGARGNFGGAAGRVGRNAGNGAFGKIIAKDATSITVQLAMSSTTNSVAGSRIVLYSSSSQIEKTVAGSASDLSVGENVSVSGTPNTDGSITAQMIQIRPAGATMFGRIN